MLEKEIHGREIRFRALIFLHLFAPFNAQRHLYFAPKRALLPFARRRQTRRGNVAYRAYKFYAGFDVSDFGNGEMKLGFFEHGFSNL